jgi:hypothetical protein
MKRKNGKKLRGGLFGIDLSAMIGLKPKDSKIDPESSIAQKPVTQEPVTHQHVDQKSTGWFSGGKKRKTQKKSKSQKNKR